MKFEQILLSTVSVSKNNVRGKASKASLKDLTASIKEKGVLVPIIVRPIKSGYEIVAGNRRYAAAVKAKLTKIPAQIKELSDDEAKEVQIIENLQREDVHPIEEGIAYRKLIEQSGYDVKVIAARVGKSESYVRYRLYLTNLIPKAITMFRDGTIKDGHAVLIARLSPEDQEDALEYAVNDYDQTAGLVEDLKDWIKERIYNDLDNQPWLKDKEANEAVGVCTKCPPNVPTLFGEIKEGACIDKKCWEIKMKKYIDFVIKRDDLVKISREYWGAGKGVLNQNHYTVLVKKDRCDFARQGIIFDGKEKGKIIWICADKECKEHGGSHAEADCMISPEEKQKQKDEKNKEEKEREADDKKEAKRIIKAVGKIKYPLTDKGFDVLFKILITENRNYFEEIAKAYGWDVLTSKSVSNDEEEPDYDKTVDEKIKTMSREEKLHFALENIVWNSYGSDQDDHIKLLNSL